MSQPDPNTFKLTTTQLSMWAGQQMHPGVPLYNTVMTFMIKGTLNPDAFERAFQKLVLQTDTLRMYFVDDGGSPVGKIHNSLPAPFEIQFLKPGEDLEEIVSKRKLKPIDISNCVYDAVLYRVDSTEYLWFFNQHHIVTDVWGASVLARRLGELYKLETGTSTDDGKLPQFTDVISRHSPGDDSDARKYWEKESEAAIPISNIYGAPSSAMDTASVRVGIDLGESRFEQLRTLGAKSPFRAFTTDMSMFNILATAFAAFLYRVSTTEQLTIGMPVHNRPDELTKQCPGVFIEFFAVNVEVKADDTFFSLHEKVRNATSGLLKNALPGTSNSRLQRNFNTVFNYINTRFSNFAGLPTSVSWEHPNHADPGHLLRLHVVHFDESTAPELIFDINTTVFEQAILRRIPYDFLQILDACLGLPDIQNGEISLTTESDKSEFLEHQKLSGDSKPTYRSVIDLFKRVVTRNPGNIALNVDAKQLTYRELDEISSRFAGYLARVGVRVRDRVAVCMHRSVDFIVTYLALQKAGAAVVPIDISNPWPRVGKMLSDCGARVLICNSGYSPLPGYVEADLIWYDKVIADVAVMPIVDVHEPKKDQIAYVIFTSGSTGTPKGVEISHGALSNYVQWASDYYAFNEQSVSAFFTSPGVDLTVTSILAPLISGGMIIVYPEIPGAPDVSVLEVFRDKRVSFVKLTPSHLRLLENMDRFGSNLSTIVVGGEQFPSELAESVSRKLPAEANIYNEYGPTEATVGCMVHQYNKSVGKSDSVPIGKAIPGMIALILDAGGNLVPPKVEGRLFLSGVGLAKGYSNDVPGTQRAFIDHPEYGNIYDTGDYARYDSDGVFTFIGRDDAQIKVNGMRVELEEIKRAVLSHPAVAECVVDYQSSSEIPAPEDLTYCVKCGLPSNYPSAVYDEHGICNICNSFESYNEKAHAYFREIDDLRNIFQSKTNKTSVTYDCIMLYSGGKDSTYALGILHDMGLKVLAFTLDNGFISEQAKANIRRVVNELGVDHVFATTPHMNEIFVDSLHRHSNVCNGCFKTIYTLSIQLALEKEIPFIVTGLSRGQFFETRLTEELFWNDDLNVSNIDATILEARKAYHKVDDAVNRCLDVSMFEEQDVFEKVRFLDFYRYTDVSLEEMYAYLDTRLPWVRPTDTGRSTNCLINKLGIFVHRKKEGYNNYAFPYSWDVRVGHKRRDAALDEINEEIEEDEVIGMMREIGYNEKDMQDETLAVYYRLSSPVSHVELRDHIAAQLPRHMIPSLYMQVESIPLTPAGKVDRLALRTIRGMRQRGDAEYVAPSTDIEELLVSIWEEVMQNDRIGIDDNFIGIGGTSLNAIRITARLNEKLGTDIAVTRVFEHATIREFAIFLEELLLNLLETAED